MFAALKTLLIDWYKNSGGFAKAKVPFEPSHPHATSSGVPAWKPYKFDLSPVDHIAIESWCGAVRHGMVKAQLSNPFATYERVIDDLSVDPRNRILPLRDFANLPKPGERHIYLRHDCDADILTALKMADFLHCRLLTGSFYLLHTSYYYGEFRDSVFYRHAAMDEFVDRLLTSKQEIGLHHDPLHIYLAHGIDGVAAMRKELEYLRSRGAAVTGVVAHNSALAYGAENFEVFHGLSLDGRMSVDWNGATLPLQTVSLAELELAYEGNFTKPALPENSGGLEAFHSYTSANTLREPGWQTLYFLNNPYFCRSNDVSVWMVSQDEWLVAHHQEPMWIKHKLTTTELLSALCELQTGRIVIAIHPEYFGG